MKLGLSKKFPRSILYVRRSVLGTGLLKLLTAVQFQALKLYIGNKRAMNSISTMLTLYQEMIFIEKGRNIDIE